MSDSFEGSSAEANDSIDEVEDMGATVFSLLPLIALVVLGSVMLAIIMKFGS